MHKHWLGHHHLVSIELVYLFAQKLNHKQFEKYNGDTFYHFVKLEFEGVGIHIHEHQFTRSKS
jgi:hypothetical protein